MTALADIELVLGDEEVFGVYEGDLFIADSIIRWRLTLTLVTLKSMQLALMRYGVYLTMMKVTPRLLKSFL